MIEGLRKNRANSIAPHSRQFRQNSRILWELTRVMADELASDSVQITRSAIVPEAFPQAKNLLLLGGRKGGNCRESGEKTLKVRDDSRDLGLLKHHLAYPDPIGIAVTAPGKVTLMSSKPTQKTTVQSSYAREC
jgi:hypothetical protein